jgi:hydrogenase maturation factor
MGKALGMNAAPPGKLSAGALGRAVFGALGAPRPEVLIGPAVGEDAAVIKWPGEKFLVFASDPIVGAAKGAGRLLVRVNVNDVACKGGEPAYMAVTIIAPPRLGESYVASVMREVSEECRVRGVAVVGGHTEFNGAYERPVLSAALIGASEKLFRADDIVPGDALYVTGHIGIEGMAIMASDRPDLLAGALSEAAIRETESWMERACVLDEARLARSLAVFMHDPTEGGFRGGVSEICRLAGLAADIDEDAVPIHEYTRRAALSLGFDPLSLVASGSLLVAVHEDDAPFLERTFGNAGTPIARVGKFSRRPFTPSGGDAPKEELWDLLNRD